MTGVVDLGDEDRPGPPARGGSDSLVPGLEPGSLRAGFVIAILFALVAQFSLLGAGLIWDDGQLVAEDERIRSLSFVAGAFGDSYFGAAHTAEMYRPVVNASFAIDWFLSGSSPGDVRVWFFHLTNLLLHAANAGLVFLFFAGMTGRRLGAPLIAAVLFAVHPLATEPVGWVAGRCDLLAAFFGLLAGTLLVRSARDRKLVLPAVAAYGLSLFAKASLGTIPVLVALSVMAYRDVPLRRLFGKRLFPRFALFVLPIVAWLAARSTVLGAPFPVGPGRKWGDSVGFLDGLLAVGRSFVIYIGNVFLPARLCGDYSGDLAFSPTKAPLGPDAGIGLGLMVAAIVVGALMLRRARWAFPVLAFTVALLPVFQFVRIGSILADRFVYFPAIFAFLLVGEGLEYVFRRRSSGAIFGATTLIVLLLTVRSHQRAEVWTDDVTFNRDVLVSYPDSRRANYRLAAALSYGSDDERAEARRRLEDAISRLARPNEELKILGALELEDGNLDRAGEYLGRALAHAADNRTRAQILYNLAVLSRRAGDDLAARDYVIRSLEKAPLPQARTLLERLGGE